MNEYTQDLIVRLKQSSNGSNFELICETVEHIRSLVSAAKEGWRYTDELEDERKRLTTQLDYRYTYIGPNGEQFYGINAGDK